MSRDNIHKTTLNGKPLGSRLDLTMVGDWGTANFHTIWGWVSAHLRWRSAPLSKFTILTGSAYRDSVDLVGMGLADLSVTTPTHIGVRWAAEGRHFYAGLPRPQLRTLGRLPQDDRLAFAVPASLGIRSFAELRERRLVEERDDQAVAQHGAAVAAGDGDGLGHGGYHDAWIRVGVCPMAFWYLSR